MWLILEYDGDPKYTPNYLMWHAENISEYKEREKICLHSSELDEGFIYRQRKKL